MNVIKNKDVCILTYQQSVIVRGIEKSIKEMDHKVTVLAEKEKLDNVRYHVDRTDLFILYLPDNVKESSRKTKTIRSVAETVSQSQKRMLVIGEKNERDELMEEFPELLAYPWVDRPVDMENLTRMVEHELVRLEKGAAPKEEENSVKKILIVDDDPSYAKMVREWIKDKYPTSVVTAGMQAIKFLVKTKVDLILLDYEMPVADGPQVFQMLKSEPETAEIPVVFLTGVGDREHVKKVLSLRPAGYLLKTTTRDGLLKYIESVLAE